MQRREIAAFFFIIATQVALAQNEAPEFPSGWTPKKPISTAAHTATEPGIMAS